mgnify:CR=1 FL=1
MEANWLSRYTEFRELSRKSASLSNLESVLLSILQPAAATIVLERLERDLFPRYTMIAWETDVRVLRPARF